MTLGAATAACFPSLGGKPKPEVVLTWQRKAIRMAILVRDMKLRVRVRRPDPLPYSDNANTAVWVGRDFPYDKAVQTILYARNYYKQIRYIALSDRNPGAPDSFHSKLFVGGATETALRLGLQAWTKEDFKRLRKVKTRKDFIALIRSRYGKARTFKVKR